MGLSVNLELEGVQVELLLAHALSPGAAAAGGRGQGGAQGGEVSLARFDLIRSRIIIESRSDGSRDVDLVSHEIKVHDTRFRGE